jgi:hypothetical protein
MQTTYFPMDIDSESTTDQDSLQHMGHPEPFSVHSCLQKRNIFKEDFHNFVAFSPQVCLSVCLSRLSCLFSVYCCSSD